MDCPPKKMAVVERWPLVAVHPSFPEIYDSVSNYYTQISLLYRHKVWYLCMGPKKSVRNRAEL